VTFTATVTGTGVGSGNPSSGSVQFKIDGANAGAPVALSGNTATYTTGTLAVTGGTPHAVEAYYLGNQNFSASSGALGGGQTVINHQPAVDSITWSVSVDPAKVNTSVSTNPTGFTDPDGGDKHTASWNWGDGTASAGSVTESNGSGTVGSASHSYAAAGIYTVTLTVTDNSGGQNATSQSVYQYVVVYDPAAGYVVGAGSYASPLGSYTANGSLAGTANFTQLNPKYATDGVTLTGGFKLSYSPASMTFTYSKLTWLVVSGNKAWLKGEGTNNVGGVNELCYFLVSVVDNTASADKIRVKIWDKADGHVVYDSQKLGSSATSPSAADDAVAAVSTNSASSLSISK
jgi:PKD repeat protein